MTTPDVQEFFNTTLPALIASAPADVGTRVPYKYSIHVSGSGGGDWVFDGGAPSCGPGTAEGKDVTVVRATVEEMQRFLASPRTALSGLTLSGLVTPLRALALPRLVDLAGTAEPLTGWPAR